MAQVRALAALAPCRQWDLGLVVGHVQHHLRDADGSAERDARFVAALAREQGLRFLRADLSGTASPVRDDDRGNCEARAREGRYAALEGMARQVEAGFVAVAHHGDDQLETLLMRLVRGSTVRGLGAMAWSRPLGAAVGPDHEPCIRLIRPLLRHTHRDAEAFLENLGQSWCEDHTNSDASRLRAKIRHEILPVLRELRPDIARHAANLTEHFRRLAALLDETVDDASQRMPRCEGDAILSRAEARALPEIVLGGLLRRRLGEAGASPDRTTRRTLEPIVRAIRDREGFQRKFNVNSGVHVLLTRDQVRIQGPR